MSFPIADKSLGQHFLIDTQIIDTITSDFSELSEVIVEIGPGPGILTKSLSHIKKPFKVIEKDNRFPKLLEEFVSKENIILADALELDYQELFKEWKWEQRKIWLVSNLPYNISAPLFIKFLQVSELKLMTLMFQREVADKIFSIDTRKGKAMNSLMALSQTFFEVSLLKKVAPESFDPPPKVESAVLSFERIERPALDISEFLSFEKFLRAIFKFRRKQVGKVLQSSYSKEKITEALEKSSLERSRRAESFNLKEIQLLYGNIKT